MRHQNGFTLIELLVVIALFGLLIGMVVPSMQKWVTSNKANASAMDVKSVLEFAKSEAVKNQADVAVRFTSGSGSGGTYTVFLDGGTNEVFDAGDSEIRSGTVQTGVSLDQPSFAGSMANVTRFNPMGMAVNFSGSVNIKSEVANIFKRVVVTNTGVIRLEKSATGEDGSWVD